MQQLTLKQEKRLLRRLQAGDRAAFRELYEAFSGRLYRAVIFPRLGVEDLAEDVLRDTFLTAYEKIGSVRWQSRSLYYWLSRIAHNKAIDVHRNRKRNERFVQGFTPFMELSSPGPKGPEERFLDEEAAGLAKDKIHAALDKLNPRYRRAVEMRFFEGIERQQCAEELEVTLGNFDVILFRALKRLRVIIETQGEQ